MACVSETSMDEVKVAPTCSNVYYIAEAASATVAVAL